MASNTKPVEVERNSGDGRPDDRLGPLAGMYSGRLLGVVVDAVGTRREFLKSRTAKRYFDGEIVTDRNRRRVFEDIGGMLVDAGVVRTSDLVLLSDVSIALEHAALRWDHVLATLQSRSGTIVDAVVESALRLMVVDLSVRAFAAYRLAGLAPPLAGTPVWALENGGGRLLRRLTAEAGMTREDLAERVGVSDQSVDNWFDGKHRPTRANMNALSRALAGSGCVDKTMREIGLCFALADMACMIAESVGRARVVSLATAGVSFVRTVMDDVAEMNRPPVEESAGSELIALRYGTAHPMSHALVRNLSLLAERAVAWPEISGSMMPWTVWLEAIASAAAGPDAAGLAQRAEDVAGYGADDRRVAADARAAAAIWAKPRGLNRRRSGDLGRYLLGEVARLRAIACANPGSPRAHCEAGAFMGMVGKNLRRRDLCDEEFRSVVSRRGCFPVGTHRRWKRGIILANVGEFEAAQEELERAKAWLRGTTPHLLQCRGYVRMNVGNFAGALADLEEVLKVRPNHAMALAWAARCAFEAGDSRKGLRLARLARRFGEPATYQEWTAGRGPW